MWVYAVISYMYFYDYMGTSGDNYCTNLINCFWNLINNGLRNGGILINNLVIFNTF